MMLGVEFGRYHSIYLCYNNYIANSELEINYYYGVLGFWGDVYKRQVRHLNSTLGATLIASSAYQKWPTWDTH